MSLAGETSLFGPSYGQGVLRTTAQLTRLLPADKGRSWYNSHFHVAHPTEEERR